MNSSQENTKRIAKNTLFLYFRLLLIVGTDLFIVRYILSLLGTIDYGIYNVIGGLVLLFSFVSNTMVSSTQRFFSYEIGRGNIKQINTLFNTSILIFILLAIIITFFGEVIGIWFLNNKMTIPPDRLNAANSVLQLTIFAFIFNIIRTPYNSLIIAYERMNIFALISIAEVIIKILSIIVLIHTSYDKLIIYSILILSNSFIIFAIYSFYCHSVFTVCKLRYAWDKKASKELVLYSGWNLIGSLSNILRNHGINLLLNVFFNPVVNAARGIAFQVNTALLQLTTNFYLAVKPQITKSYAIGDKKTMINLVFQSAKYSYFLVLLLSLPIIFQTKFILKLWLNELPSYVVIFTQLVVINALIEVINMPLVSAIQATGRIRSYQISVSLILLLNLPISYLFLKGGAVPEVTMVISIILSCLSFIPRLIIFKKIVDIGIKDFIVQVILRICIVTILLTISLFTIQKLNLPTSPMFFLTCSVDIMFGIVFILYFGMKKTERLFIFKYINQYANKRFH